MKYNDSPITSVIAYSPRVKRGKKYYYSQTKAKLYDGNSYKTFNANKSPMCKAPRGGAEASCFESIHIGNSSYTCGSDWETDSDGNSPEYIEAIGKNGKAGYVSNAELLPDYIHSSIQTQVIPVYDRLGNIIDAMTNESE